MVRVWDPQKGRDIIFGRGQRSKIYGGKYEGQIDIVLRLIQEHGQLTNAELYPLMKPAPHPSIRRCLGTLSQMGKIRKLGAMGSKDSWWVLDMSW